MAISIKDVQKAISIQGYVTFTQRGIEQRATSIKVVGSRWVTDVPSADLMSFAFFEKSPAKESLTAQARRIINNAEAITAARAARLAEGVQAMSN
jgi:hypothetical protein